MSDAHQEVSPGPAASLSPLEERQYWTARQAQGERSVPLTLRVLLLGTFTTQPLEPYLGADMLRWGAEPAVLHAAYNQVYPELLSPDSASRSSRPDVVVLLWRMEELLAGALQRLRTDPEAARELMRDELARLMAAIRAYLDAQECLFLVSNPPRPDSGAFGILDPRLENGVGGFHLDTLAFWRRLVAAEPRVHLLDLDGMQREFGATAAANPKMWLLARMPWTEAFSRFVGQGISRTIRAAYRPARKVLVLDGDNTLWGGVVGEDGPLGVDVGEDAPGNAFTELQRHALALRDRGILLALASKNEEADVREVFERHPGMLLRWEHFAATRVNWKPKSENLRAMAQELALGVDSLVMVDDSPAECAEIGANAPEVAVIQLDGDPSGFVRQLRTSPLFDSLVHTREDESRARLYTEERSRESLKATAVSLEQYLADLGLVVTISLAREEHVARLAQLVNKTNQFNLTTIRRTEPEVRALFASPEWRLYTVEVSDRFGEYGLTGLAFCRNRVETWEIDTFLLSCRVLGRGVETALLAHLLDEARKADAVEVRGYYRPSAKNGICAEFYPTHGFPAAQEGCFIRSAAAPLSVPGHLTLVRSDA